VAEAHRLRVHVVGVDQLYTDDHDVVCDQARSGAAPVCREQVAARRALAVGEVDQHLAVHQRNGVLPEVCLISIRGQGLVRTFGDAQSPHECRFATRVVGARLRDSNRDAPHRIGRIGNSELVARDSRGGASEDRKRAVVGGADEHDVARIGDRLRQLRVARARVVEHHVEQDHLGMQAREVVDHLRVYVVAPRVGTERPGRRRVERDEGHLRRRLRRWKQLVLKAIEKRRDHSRLRGRDDQDSGEQAGERETPRRAPVAHPLADHATLS